MNKEVIDCIQADIDRKNKEKKEKEELIQKIYDFFKDLPKGEYRIDLFNTIEKEIKDHWYSKPYTHHERIPKEEWLYYWPDWIVIRNNEIIKIERVSYHGVDITRWNLDEVQIFYNHLDWFENELKEQYCKGKA